MGYIKTITYKNKKYNSLKKLAENYNIPYYTLSARLNKHKWSVKKAIETPIKDKTKKIIYNNKTYASIKNLAKEYNIDYKLLYDRLIRDKWSIEKAIKTPIKDNTKKIIYKNKTYDSLKNLAKEYKINYTTLKSRIYNLGWSIEKAIEPSSLYSVPKGFKTFKLAYTHNNTNYYECIYNNQKYILSIQEMYALKENDNAIKNF